MYRRPDCEHSLAKTADITIEARPELLGRHVVKFGTSVEKL